MYASENFKSKKALKEAIKAGRTILIESPGPFPAPTNGRAAVEGPWYPEAHRWYAEVQVVDGRIVKAK
jgi:hypothetical protein